MDVRTKDVHPVELTSMRWKWYTPEPHYNVACGVQTNSVLFRDTSKIWRCWTVNKSLQSVCTVCGSVFCHSVLYWGTGALSWFGVLKKKKKMLDVHVSEKLMINRWIGKSRLLMNKWTVNDQQSQIKIHDHNITRLLCPCKWYQRDIAVIITI